MLTPDTKTAARRKDLYAGLTFVVVAALFAGHSMLHDIGTPLRMGPGFFPLVVSLLLGAMGLAIVLRPLCTGIREMGNDGRHPMPWRGALLILGGPVVFSLTIVGLGLIPATAMVVLMGAFASPDMTWRGAVLSTLLVTVGCLAIFYWGLGLPLRLLGTWIV